MVRATINSDTFIKIFKSQDELLAMMASSLTKLDYNLFKNNITCDPNNPNNLEYVIRMPNDYTIEIINTKTEDIIKINF